MMKLKTLHKQSFTDKSQIRFPNKVANISNLNVKKSASQANKAYKSNSHFGPISQIKNQKIGVDQGPYVN